MKNRKSIKSKSLISRRAFINKAAAGTVFIAMGPVTGIFGNDLQQAEAWLSDASKFRFHMIGHGHIDPAMLAEIRKRVAEGRWNIVGGWGFPTGKGYSRLARAL